MVDRIRTVQTQEFRLAGAGVSSTDTTVRVRNFTQIEGTDLVMADFGAKGYGTLEPNTSREEQIVWTGVTVNGDGTSTLTGVSRVLKVAPYTETSGLASAHAGGTVFVVSDNPGLFNTFANKLNDETIEETWTYTNPNYPRMDNATPDPTDPEQLITKQYSDAQDLLLLPLDGSRPMTGNLNLNGNFAVNSATPPVNPTDLASKQYVDDTASAGAPDATPTQKGIIEIATDTEADDNTSDVNGAGVYWMPKISDVHRISLNTVSNYPGVGSATNKPFENFQLLFMGISSTATSAGNAWDLELGNGTFETISLAALVSGDDNNERYTAKTNSVFVNYDDTGSTRRFNGTTDIIFEQSFRRSSGGLGASTPAVLGLTGDTTSIPQPDISTEAGIYLYVDNTGAGFAYTGNGTAATRTAVTISASTTYLLRVEYNPGVDVRFYLNGTLVATHTTNIPTSTDIIEHIVHNQNNTTGQPLISVFGAPSYAIEK